MARDIAVGEDIEGVGARSLGTASPKKGSHFSFFLS
jgi:hypothetical protein